ncbi:hypothetical protein CCACVL1_24876 [Corchorus capsularis]|uniref:Uncharacterized protein n=1 Tax=Corchorus capsularis TaxID=210143 RepID=A0A1R3GMM8_COCAP|nr:hypothetical protein CCACVL1_24876 [Corchorus capsularis]
MADGFSQQCSKMSLSEGQPKTIVLDKDWFEFEEKDGE